MRINGPAYIYKLEDFLISLPFYLDKPMMCAAASIAEYHLYTHSPAVTQVPLYVTLPRHLVLHIDPRHVVVSQLVDLLHQAQHHHLGSQQLLYGGGDQPDLLPPVLGES